MKKVIEVMTKDVETISPNDSLKDAAEKMRALNVGPLPVCDGDRLKGIITDRDIVVRAISKGLDPNNTRVSQAMTDDIDYVYENDDIEKVELMMKENQIRRVLVVNQDKKLVGIISLGDLAEALGTKEAGSTLESISEPSHPSTH
ncbi:CBS domain-containing protein [Myxococcus sp. RHSTA-1-4]|uniref:CBS domain-containing protein n=1 Tax=Myxococcus sp. RHSTA-1-4 TaxID=2874601 RepID=UPI001CBFBDB2|nr:CBS domain-containing protein [Myxococcus sp. RHSTA-1-4]MBZ4417655.1 CBS domain-containing protein [Myxococcus sp. RHSTA-1-4]